MTTKQTPWMQPCTVSKTVLGYFSYRQVTKLVWNTAQVLKKQPQSCKNSPTALRSSLIGIDCK